MGAGFLLTDIKAGNAIAHGAILTASSAAEGLPGLSCRNAGDQDRGDGCPSVPALRSHNHDWATSDKEQIARRPSRFAERVVGYQKHQCIGDSSSECSACVTRSARRPLKIGIVTGIVT